MHLKMNQPVTCISQSGIVDRVTDQSIFVQTISVSACASCHAKGACQSSDMSPKMIEIDRSKAPSVRPGEQVKVVMQESLGLSAVFIGYIVPLLLLLITLGILSLIATEAVAGLTAIVLLVPYYLILYFFRHRLKKKFSFTIE